MAFFFEVQTQNGQWLDLLPYIAERGLQWSRNDVDSEESGRVMNTDMDRLRLGIKTRWDVSLRPLYTDELSPILNAILPEFIIVHCSDPLFGERTVRFYSNNTPATGATIYDDGNGNFDAEWEAATFPLIEK